jgi:hypothetical protein
VNGTYAQVNVSSGKPWYAIWGPPAETIYKETLTWL